MYLLAGDGEPGNHVFFAAADGAQAGIAAKHAIEMVKASPVLEKEIAINLTEKKLTHRPTLSDAKPISSGDNRAAKAKQGLNGCVVIDEIHVVTRQFISESSIDKAGASRDEPLHIEVSTSGKDPDGYGAQQYNYGKQVESGEVEDQGYFFLCYEAPQQLSDAQLAADPIKWGRLANPTWGRIIQEEEFLSDYNRSSRSLVDLADFKTFRLNIWQTTASPWIAKADWDACFVPFTEEEMLDRVCAAGLDLAITRDMSALSLVFPMDQKFRWLCWFFMPEAGVKRLAIKQPKVHEWVRDGWIIVTDGETTDYRYIRRVFAEKAKTFYISQLLYDEHFAEQLTQEMSEDTGVDRFKLPQTITRLNEPTQNMERLILERLLEHNGNPVLSWQMGHANVKSDANGNKRLVKPDHADHKKIDGPISGIAALAGARTAEQDDNWFREGGGLTGGY